MNGAMYIYKQVIDILVIDVFKLTFLCLRACLSLLKLSRKK